MATFGNIITGLTALIFIGVSGACDTGSFPRCVAGFSRYQTRTSIVVPKYTKAELQDICRLFTEANTCLARALVGCPSEVLTMWSGVEDEFQYLCSEEGTAGYEKHGDCWGNAVLERQGQSCNSSYQSSVKDMTTSAQNGGYDSSQEFTADICTATNRFLQCIYVTVETTCGVEAADWHLKLTEIAVRPTLSIIQCTLDRSNGAGGLTAGGGLLWVLALLLVYTRSNLSI